MGVQTRERTSQWNRRTVTDARGLSEEFLETKNQRVTSFFYSSFAFVKDFKRTASLATDSASLSNRTPSNRSRKRPLQTASLVALTLPACELLKQKRVCTPFSSLPFFSLPFFSLALLKTTNNLLARRSPAHLLSLSHSLSVSAFFCRLRFVAAATAVPV